jgi:cysteine desulfurase
MCEEALESMIKTARNNYGNPSSVHLKGAESENILNLSREKLAENINCEKHQIYFTSGGTESNNIAILGSIAKNRKLGDKIVTTSIEHPSVLEPIKHLERKGYEVKYVKSTPSGIDTDDLIRSIDDRTALVSVMMVNNETGEKIPVEKIKNIIKFKRSKAIFHVDAVQAFCKTHVDVLKLGVDLLSVSAHKVHGPMGIGALYVLNKNLLSPIIFGGGQENNLRSGTQPVEIISGFSEAIRSKEDIDLYHNNVNEINNYLINKIHKINSISVNSPPNSIPYILNLSIEGIPSEVMVNYLSDKGIYVSAGSACSKNKKSRVLSNMGLSENRINTAIRVSFSRFSTREEVDIFVKAVTCAIENLSKK